MPACGGQGGRRKSRWQPRRPAPLPRGPPLRRDVAPLVKDTRDRLITDRRCVNSREWLQKLHAEQVQDPVGYYGSYVADVRQQLGIGERGSYIDDLRSLFHTFPVDPRSRSSPDA